MEFFDLRTAYLIMGVLYFCMPLAVWLALRENLNPAVSEWCGGGVMFGIGLFFLGMRGQLPAWVTFEIAGALMNAGNLARIAALRRGLQRPLHRRWQIVLLSPFFLGYEAARWFWPVGAAPYLISLGFMSVYMAWIAALALQLGRQHKLQSAYWLSLVYLLLAALLFVQWLRVGLGHAHLQPLAPDGGAVLLVMMGNLTAVIGNTSFLGMFAEHATRQRLALTQEQARAAENARLASQIAQLDRARSLGMMSMSLAHEISQPLTSLNLNAELAMLETETSPPSPVRIQQHLQNILRQSRHASEVVQRIRNFITVGNTSFSRVNLQQIHADVLALLQNWLNTEQVQIEVSQPEATLWVQGDAVALAQVLVNIYRNAIQAMAGQPDKRINAQLSQADGLALVLIHDQGPGFSAEALERSSETIFSTKSEGLGMGLLISRQIAEQHHGSLRLRNAAAGGALVELALPAMPSA